MSFHLVIIGNGISGITAARFVRKRDARARITVISDETDFFYARTALMYVYMGQLRLEDTKPYEDRFWSENRITCVRDRVEAVAPDAKRVSLRSGRTIDYDVLVVATGSKTAYYEWPGQELEGVQGLYGVPDLEQMERSTRGVRRAVVVGGGLVGIEMAEMLHSRDIPVTFLVREAAYMDYLLPAEESGLVRREIERHGIDLRLGTELAAVLPDDAGRARAVVTTDGEEIPCEFVGIATGVRPNVDFLRGSEIDVNRGVVVNEYFETSCPGVYAVGDCAEIVPGGGEQGRVEQLWYTGRRHGKLVAETICGDRQPYRPAVFYNSAKFFTVEYQTYGVVSPRLPAGHDTFVWEDPRHPRLLRMQFEKESRRVVGFNVLGTRYRHEVCASWIRAGRTVEYVLAHLGEANFDPEFTRPLERIAAGGEPPERGEEGGEQRRGWLRRLMGRRSGGARGAELVAAGETPGVRR